MTTVKLGVINAIKSTISKFLNAHTKKASGINVNVIANMRSTIENLYLHILKKTTYTLAVYTNTITKVANKPVE